MSSSGTNEHFRPQRRAETNIAQRWSKSFVERELRDEAVLQREGIELDLATARLVALVLSRVVWHGDDRARETLYKGWCLIKRVATVRVPDGSGGYLPPLLAAGSEPQVPCGVTSLRRLGIESATISALRTGSPTFATSCLPLPVLLEFLPAPAWPFVAAVIGCDPDRDLLPRVHEALREHGHSVGAARLRSQVHGLGVLLGHLCDLRRELAAENAARVDEKRDPIGVPRALEQWVHSPKQPTLPELEAYGQGGSRQDRSAIPQPTLVAALKTLVRNTRWGRYRPEEWPVNRSWRELKRLAVLCVLLTGCPRVGHLQRLDVDDFDPAHTFEDGTTGPGLRFRRSLMKNGGRSKDAYWKRLPDFVGAVLAAWICCSGRSIGQPNAPLFISKEVTEPDQVGARYAGADTIRAFIAGNSRQTSRPLIPLPGLDRKGYLPHRFRNTMIQLVERLFANWKIHNPGHHLAAYAAHDVAEIAVDHKVDDLGYRDYKQRKRLEELLALVIELVWAEVWGDGLQERGFDPEEIDRAYDAVTLIEAELQLLEQQILELEGDDIAALKRSQRAANQDEKLSALLASQMASSQIRQKLRRQIDLKDELLSAKDALERAKTTPVPLSDDLRGETHAIRLAEALARAEGRSQPQTETAQGPLASELTTEDIAELFQRTPTHVRRWRRGNSSPPIDPSRWIKLNEKDWRYPVAAIDGRSLARAPAADPHAALDVIRRKRAAVGFGVSRKGGEISAVA